MNWLSLFARHGCIAAVETVVHSVAEDRVRDLNRKFVCENLPKKKGREWRGILLQIAPVPVKWPIFPLDERIDVRKRAATKGRDYVLRNGIREDNESVTHQRVDSCSKVVIVE